MSRTIPIINTSRVSLRPMRPEDFDRFAEIWSDPAVTAEIRGPQTRSESWDTFLRIAGHWQMTGFGQWAISDAQSRHLIGQTGFFLKDRGLGEDFDSFPEVGWVLARDAQGQGYAHEATLAAHEWFDRVVHGPIVALITRAHARSLSLAQTLGYREMREVQMDGVPVVLLKRHGPPPI